MVTEDQIKQAAARLFYDMIVADGIIEDQEIETLRLKMADYGISDDDLRKCHAITSSDAISVLRRYCLSEKTVRRPNNSPYDCGKILSDLEELSGCDGDRDISEARLIAAVRMCIDLWGAGKSGFSPLSGENKLKYGAIPLKFKEGNFRFSRREILYVSTQDHKSSDNSPLAAEIEHELLHSSDRVKYLLGAFGFDFVYLEQVGEFLKNKAAMPPPCSDGSQPRPMLEAILRFSKPMDISAPETAIKFINAVRELNTAQFTKHFLSYVCEDFKPQSLPPSLLVKVKTSVTYSRQDDGSYKPGKYSDFIAIPIHTSIYDTAKAFTELILKSAGDIHSLVRLRSEDKLYCKGIHKTVIDYVTDQLMQVRPRTMLTLYRETRTVILEGKVSETVRFGAQFDLYLAMVAFSDSPEEGKDRGIPTEKRDQDQKRLREFLQKVCGREDMDGKKPVYLRQGKRYLSKVFQDHSIGLHHPAYPKTDNGYYKVDTDDMDVWVQDRKDSTPIPLADWRSIYGIT